MTQNPYLWNWFQRNLAGVIVGCSQRVDEDIFFASEFSCLSYNSRVATAQGKQGKQGIWFLLFPDRENTGNFALTQGKILRHREKFRHRENI